VRRHGRRRGIALAWSAIVLIVMVGMVGLSIDWGKLVWNAHQLQNAADAAALAGAYVVKYNYSNPDDPQGARSRAIALALANIADQRAVSLDRNADNAVDGEIVLGRWIRQERLFVPTMLSPSAVKVVDRRLGQRDNAPALSLVFGAIFGTAQAGASRQAIGWSRQSTGAGILQLADQPETLPGVEQPTGFVWNGGPASTIDLRGYDWQTGEPILGDIQVDAESEKQPKAAFVINGGKGEIWGGDINICGTSNPEPDSDWSSYYGDSSDPEYWFSVNPQSDRIEDPLIDVSPPVLEDMPTFSQKIDDNFIRNAVAPDEDGVYRYEIPPGYYSGGIEIGKVAGIQTQVVLEGGMGDGRSGVFAFGGAGLVIGGTSSVVEKYPPVNADGTAVPPTYSANRGVMVYITGTGAVTIHGGGYLQISPRGDWLDPRVVNGELGVSIWQDRSDHNQAVITGSSNYFVSGTVYMGYNAVKVAGSVDHLGTQLIIGALELDRGASVRVAYDGRNRYDSARAFLVN
jgi:Flp pilus assembly protein TadG